MILWLRCIGRGVLSEMLGDVFCWYGNRGFTMGMELA